MPIFDQSFRKYDGPRNINVLWWPIAVALVKSQLKNKFLWVLTGFFVIYLVVISVGFIAAVVSTELLTGDAGSNAAGMARKNSMLIFDESVNLNTVLFATMQPLFNLIWLIVLSIGAASISADKKYNAFPLYFSRPLRPSQYIIGKILGVTLVPGVLLYAGMLILGIQYLAYFVPFSEMYKSIPTLLGAGVYIFIICGFAGLLMTSISSMVKNSRNAGLIFIMFLFIMSRLANGLSRETDFRALRALSPRDSLNRIGSLLMRPDFNEIRDTLFTGSITPSLAILSICVYSVIFFLILKRNLKADEVVK